MRTLLFVVLFATVRSAVTAADYKPISTIPIEGEGGWDILAVDDASRRLYLSHASKVAVVDIDANKAVGEIADTPGVHAFVPIPKWNRGFSSNGKENKTSLVDLKTLPESLASITIILLWQAAKSR